jgi:methanogenic corrinoid protein MtbC1
VTDEEILQLLYDETLVGNAPVVRQGVEDGLEQGMAPDRLLYDALIPSLEEVGARFERGDFFVPEMLIAARAMQRSTFCGRCWPTPARRRWGGS